MKKAIIIDGQEFELVEFINDEKYPQQGDCYMLRPIRKEFGYKKMTKAELIERIEELENE